MKKIWIATRSVGRKQLISWLACVYNCTEIIKGVIIVGTIDDVSRRMLIDLEKRMQVVLVEGKMSLGVSTIKMIEAARDVGDVLFADDDVLFKKEDIIRCQELSEKYDVVSVLTRQPEIDEETIIKWVDIGMVEFHFSYFKEVVFEVMKMTKAPMVTTMMRFKYGGEFYYLTWLLRRCQFNIKCEAYSDRPFHLFVPSVGSEWRKASLEEWEVFRKDIMGCIRESEIVIFTNLWNEMIDKRIENAT